MRALVSPDRLQTAGILLVPGFLGREACADIIRAFNRCSDAADKDVRRFPNRTEIPGSLFASYAGNGLANTLADLRQRVVEKAQSFFDENGLRVEFTLLSQMRPGDAHGLHADNERRHPAGGWVPNHTPYHSHAAMVYLNTSGTDYQGGAICFPGHGMAVAPQAGDLVSFLCSHVHEHEVKTIESGMRYSISIWLTKDAGHAEAWAA